jgi:hypothetical protein
MVGRGSETDWLRVRGSVGPKLQAAAVQLPLRMRMQMQMQMQMRVTRRCTVDGNIYNTESYGTVFNLHVCAEVARNHDIEAFTEV